MIELVIFDCDGVLIDSERLAVKVDAIVLTALGWPMSEAEIVERFVGRSHASMTADIEAHLGRRLPPDWDAEFKPLYDEVFERELTPVTGILQALDAIDLPSCVASSSSHARLRRTLGLTGLYERFAGRIFSAEEVAHGKPAPDLFLHAARQSGVEPSACAVVEDSHFGLAAARAAGMRSFGYCGGLSRAERLAGPGTVVFDDMRDLPELLAAAEDEDWGGDGRGRTGPESYPAPDGSESTEPNRAA